MPTREEIRARFKEYLRPNLKYEDESLIDGVVDMALLTLHSQGVVIKVERELPLPAIKVGGNYNVGYYTGRFDMVSDGYVATESLIEEESNARRPV